MTTICIQRPEQTQTFIDKSNFLQHYRYRYQSIQEKTNNRSINPDISSDDDDYKQIRKKKSS